MRRAGILSLLVLLGCGAGKPASQAYLGGQAIDLAQLTPAEVAREVRIIPREQDVVFQAPTVQTNKLIDLRSAGKQIGLALGDVERVRLGYLSGVLDRRSGSLTHYLLFQSNFVLGNEQYGAVNLADGRPLQFTVARAPDPCVPNCFPVVEALIVSIPDPTLRANAGTGLPLTITLNSGDVISFKGLPAYVQGYLLAVDGYRRSGASGGMGRWQSSGRDAAT